MQITTTDGTRNVASAGVGGAGLGLGIAGTALALMNGGLGNVFGGGSSQYATKDDLAYAEKIAAKDSEIALLKSEQNTENKITDVYERIMTRVNSDARNQADVNAAQAVINAQVGANIAVTQNDVAGLQTLVGNLTKTVIPINNVCPEPMQRYNSWTAPTTPTTD